VPPPGLSRDRRESDASDIAGQVVAGCAFTEPI
jgi:hypothetical protein